MMEQHTPGSTSAIGGALIGLDWGTSSLRAYLFAPGGRIIDRRSASWGIQHLPAGGYAAAFRQIAGDWQARSRDLPIVAAGMVGSRNGWHEVPYVSCPADAAAIAAGIVPFPSECGLIHLVPGLVQGGSEPDVMRGEETQVVGALERDPAPAADSLFVLPGTHSKWVRVEDGRVMRFSTHLTGELFALLRDHSIIGRPAREASAVADDPAAAAFKRGVDVARASGPAGISGRLFTARSLFLCGQLPAADTLAYLSGMLVGEEIRSVLAGSAEGPRRCVVVGDAALAERYRIALLAFGITHPRACADTAPDGLWRIATAAGLVPRSAAG